MRHHAASPVGACIYRDVTPPGAAFSNAGLRPEHMFLSAFQRKHGPAFSPAVETGPALLLSLIVYSFLSVSRMCPAPSLAHVAPGVCMLVH